MPGRYPTTPDGRYFVVGTTLWRCTNPNLPADVREEAVKRLMNARRSVAKGKLENDAEAIARARRAVDRAKRDLGERGKPWWTDGSPDYNRHKVTNSPYREWFESLPAIEPD